MFFSGDKVLWNSPIGQALEVQYRGEVQNGNEKFAVIISDGFQMSVPFDQLEECGNGYICKECGEPSPLGVGYVSNEKGAYLKSKDLYECACGHSIHALKHPEFKKMQDE